MIHLSNLDSKKKSSRDALTKVPRNKFKIDVVVVDIKMLFHLEIILHVRMEKVKATKMAINNDRK